MISSRSRTSNSPASISRVATKVLPRPAMVSTLRPVDSTSAMLDGRSDVVDACKVGETALLHSLAFHRHDHLSSPRRSNPTKMDEPHAISLRLPHCQEALQIKTGAARASVCGCARDLLEPVKKVAIRYGCSKLLGESTSIISSVSTNADDLRARALAAANGFECIRAVTQLHLLEPHVKRCWRGPLLSGRRSRPCSGWPMGRGSGKSLALARRACRRQSKRAQMRRTRRQPAPPCPKIGRSRKPLLHSRRPHLVNSTAAGTGERAAQPRARTALSAV